MKQQIRLTRIHAINWYGYEDSLPVTGNVLLAGVTGSGKSVLMDLIQAVLLGPGGARYNLAASSEKSRRPGRTLKGYCLGDTKEEEDGVEQYMRDHSITFIALEFTWPGDMRVETWGFRIEFGSSADAQPRDQTPFVIPRGLERSAWLDDRRKPLTLAAFRGVVDEFGGRCFNTVEEYRETIAGSSRLNFDRAILDRLLPMAMSFTVRDNFDTFCRSHILPSEPVKVDHVISSYRIFQQYERELLELKQQLVHLDAIFSFDEKRKTILRDSIVYRHAYHELALESAENERLEKKRILDDLQEALKLERHQLEQVRREVVALKAKRDDKWRLVNADPQGGLCLHLRAQCRVFAEELAGFAENAGLSSSTLRERLSCALVWLQDLRKSTMSLDSQVLAGLENQIRRTEVGGLADAEKNLTVLKEKSDEVMGVLLRTAEPLIRRLNEIRREREALKLEIGRLALGWMPFRTPLLEALTHRLPHEGSRPAARHLRELCEVTDENWRAALESSFTEKFAILVSDESYPEAERLFRELKMSDLGENVGRESLVRTSRIPETDPGHHPESLAAKLSCEEPNVRVLINQLLGDVICVESADGLEGHERAILADGFSVSAALAERHRFYDGNPVVGKNGIQQQLTAKRTRDAQLRIEEDQISPLESSVRDMQARHASTFLLSPAFVEQCRTAGKLHEIKALHDKNREDLERLVSGLRGELLVDLEAAEKALDVEETKERDLLKRGRANQLPNAESELEKATGAAEKARNRFEEVKKGLNILPHLLYLQEVVDVVKRDYASLALAADECKTRQHNADLDASKCWNDLVRAREKLATEHRRYQDLDPEASSNAEYELHRKRISDAEIDAYKEKSQTERLRWETLFREQVLEKMRAALSQVDDLLRVLTSFLKHPIGNTVYKIQWRDNPSFEVYHQLLHMSSMAKPGELWFVFADQKLQDAVASFFRLLLEAPDSKEAQRLLDYRNYYKYDMTQQDIQPGSRPVSVDRQADKFSGGENQTPYFIAILASYLRAYRRHGKRKEPSLALVPIDEAFSKLSGDRIQDCISALKSQNLQGVLSMSTGNIPYAYSLCDQLIVITKKDTYEKNRLKVRNQPANMLRGAAEEREWLESGGNLWS